ncbi:MAG: hypothetical protein OXD29_03360 [Roseovarius sp.]|nr:hypothetical protein [Roseovarius sp.]
MLVKPIAAQTGLFNRIAGCFDNTRQEMLAAFRRWLAGAYAAFCMGMGI